MRNTQYTLVQAILSVEADERMTIGVLMSDGEHTDFVSSDAKLELFRQWRGDNAYDIMHNIINNLSSNEEQRRRVMTPNYHAYLRRYANNFVTVSPLQTINSPLGDDLKERLLKQYVNSCVPLPA